MSILSVNLQKNDSKIIINADDFGITQGVNKAIFELVDAGIVASTSVMTNMPHYRDIAGLNHKIGIGIHFNLTTGRPILESNRVQTLVDKHGNFLKLPELVRKALKGQISKKEAELELSVQVEKLTELNIEIDHIDSHESLLKHPFFIPIMKKVAKKYGILAVRTYSPRKFDYTRIIRPKRILISLYLAFQKVRWKQAGFNVADRYDSLIKVGLDYKTAIGKLKDIFYNAPQGILEVSVHPGYCNGDNLLLGKYVYEREIELQTLMSDEFKEIIKSSKVELISFKDLQNSADR